MSNTVLLVLRRMRVPLITLIAIYSVSILGLMLVPGVDAEGNPGPPLNFFHAFYFVSYTATTIGFGELPGAFSDAQRLWVTTCIYLTVIGWTYAIVTTLALLQEKGFRTAMAANQFGRRVRRIREPFYLVCGCGATGTLVARSLGRIDRQCVIVELDELRVQELGLEDIPTDPPILAADAGLPANLMLAGLCHPQCRGVMALTNDDHANLAVAISARLLNPAHPVLARTTDAVTAANMASFGTHHIINAFEEFAEEFALSIAAPDRLRLVELVTALPGEDLPAPHRPPRGSWIVVGYGRFGRAVTRQLRTIGIDVTVVDPIVRQGDVGAGLGITVVTGRGTEADALTQARVDSAVGIVAATDNDADNLSVVMTARELQPDLFVVVRQNDAANQVLFDAFDSEFDMVPSTIVAEECLTIVTTPLLSVFVQELRSNDESWCAGLADRLQEVGRGRVPRIWDVTLDAAGATAVQDALRRGSQVRLGDLLRDPADREVELDVLALLWMRAGRLHLLPEPDQTLQTGDRLLFAGRSFGRLRMESTLQNLNVLQYVLSGQAHPGGWVWQRLTGSARRR
jgi:Trk K+ transport system NAD-binding subunit